MNIEELLHGESKNIEYKEKLPSNSDRYTRTVVAFANSQGAKLFSALLMAQTELSELMMKYFFR